MRSSDLSRLFEAHDAVWAVWWPALTLLPDPDAVCAFASSYPSVFATVKHMVVAEAFWQHLMDERPYDAAVDAADNLRALERAWRALQLRRVEWLASADPDGAVAFTLESGFSGTAKVWECAVHVTSHAHYHRGQIVTLFRLLGRQPPAADLLTGLAIAMS